MEKVNFEYSDKLDDIKDNHTTDKKIIEYCFNNDDYDEVLNNLITNFHRFLSMLNYEDKHILNAYNKYFNIQNEELNNEI